MHPFFYPTTTIVIDDEQTFLESMHYNLSDDFLCRSFTNTDQAIDFIQRRHQENLDIEHFFLSHQNNHDLDVGDHGDMFIKVQSTYWFHLLQAPSRFDEISVAVIDYSMPQINGADLCRKLKDLPMKKIMLTGQADEEIAVKAFNEKIIDSFIQKQESHRLRAEIEKHTKEYFKEKTRSFSLAFSLQEARFIKDQQFQQIFEAYREENKIEEYYVNTQPPGILMFDDDGHPNMMIVYGSERVRAHFEIAEEMGAPQELLAALVNKEVIALFPTDSGYYHPLYARDWQKHVYPTQKIDGDDPIFFAVLHNADFVLEHLNRYIPLNQHRKLVQMPQTG